MKILDQIVEWVKVHGNSARFKDEPYMEFMAEYQDWSFAQAGLTQLHIGYFAVDEWGDTTFDPLLMFTLEGDDVKDVQMTTVMGDTLPISLNNPFVLEFLDTV